METKQTKNLNSFTKIYSIYASFSLLKKDFATKQTKREQRNADVKNPRLRQSINQFLQTKFN